ncbi:MAG: hypothetical protein ABSF26_19450 [Thermoguttaceae bacterium]
MNWQNHRVLAIALRDQGLADCIAARRNLSFDTVRILQRQTNLAHLVVAKCQQALEKLTKGYLLWHAGSFDPTKGHCPFSEALGANPEVDKLCAALNKINPGVVRDLKWLETLAPQLPDVPPGYRGRLVPLEFIRENSEYPYWSNATGTLVIATQGLTIQNQARRAITAVRSFLRALALSDPAAFTSEIRDFLREFPFSTAIAPAEAR